MGFRRRRERESSGDGFSSEIERELEKGLCRRIEMGRELERDGDR